jgi:hypothetical protein
VIQSFKDAKHDSLYQSLIPRSIFQVLNKGVAGQVLLHDIDSVKVLIHVKDFNNIRMPSDGFEDFHFMQGLLEVTIIESSLGHNLDGHWLLRPFTNSLIYLAE